VTVVDLADEAPAAAMFGSPGHDPVDDLWARLRRPFDPVTVTAAITGLSVSVATAVVGAAVADSAEAERLLDELPRTMRSLAMSMTSHHERCRGELRGPVLWSETMSARASTFGDEQVFVCALPSRAYDVDENRVLVTALLAVSDAAHLAVEHAASDEHGSDALRRIRRNGSDARRFAEHPTLLGVARGVPGGRALKRTRAGKKARLYEPALRLLTRAANPVAADDLRAWCDRRTRAQLRMLTGVLAGLEHAGTVLPPVRAVAGHLEVGGLSYHHGHLLGDRRSLSGVVAGPLLIDVPDVLGDTDRARAGEWLAERAGGRRAVLVADDDDLDRAVAQVVEHRSEMVAPADQL
jgi:hypothetical protein